jgi:predicted DNA-binding transcriptional regulator AlpA
MVGRQTTPSVRSWIGVKEAAAIVGVSPDWIRDHMGDPGWPRYYRVGANIRWDVADFMAWRDRQYVHPPAEKETQCTSLS